MLPDLLRRQTLFVAVVAVLGRGKVAMRMAGPVCVLHWVMVPACSQGDCIDDRWGQTLILIGRTCRRVGGGGQRPPVGCASPLREWPRGRWTGSRKKLCLWKGAYHSAYSSIHGASSAHIDGCSLRCLCIRRTERFRTSDENLIGFLFKARFSQEFEPPQYSVRFSPRTGEISQPLGGL